jgi:hypothetical protein
MLTDLQLKQGFEENNKKLEAALTDQLFCLYRRIVPTSNQVRYIIEFPQAAVGYRLEYINIAIPASAYLDNFFFVATDDSNGIKYVSENLRRGYLGAKLNLFTSPGADKDPATAGDQKSYTGMLPINIKFKGTEQATLYFRGNGLSTLSFIDVFISGHQENRITNQGGYNNVNL